MEPSIASVLTAGTILQEYEISQVLGRPGGFGITYLATDTHLSKKVAIKEYLPTEFALRLGNSTVSARSEADREAFEWGRKAFVKEARVLAQFSHPNIVQVYRFFEANGTAYIVMEHIQGETLLEKLKGKNAFDEQRLLGILLPILDGLEVVHKAGVLHRDIKSENILIRSDGSPVLIDFGAARNALSTASKSVMNMLTAGYAPIEQYSETDQQGPWTDLYSLGAVACRVITGKKPPDAISRLRNDPIPTLIAQGRGAYSDHLLSAVEWALTIDHHRRPQNAAQWRQALLSVRTDPVSGSPVSDDMTFISRPGARLPAAENSARPQAAAPAVTVSPRPKPGAANRKPDPGAEPDRGRWIAAASLALLAVVAAAGAGYFMQTRKDAQATANPDVQALPPVAEAIAPAPAAPVATAPAEEPPPRKLVLPPPQAERPASAERPAPVAAAPKPTEKPAEKPAEKAIEKPAEKPVVEDVAETTYWNGIQGNDDPDAFNDYLRRWPKGRYADAARNQIKVLKDKLAAENKAVLAAASKPEPKPEPVVAAPAPPAPTVIAAAEPAAAAKPAEPAPPAVAPKTAPAAVAPVAAPPTTPEVEQVIPRPVRIFRDCPECPEMAMLPAGQFRMGSPADEEMRGNDESPPHLVSLQRPFAIGRYEVTFDQWEHCVSKGGCSSRPNDRGWGRGKRPVINITLDDAAIYARWLSQTTGQSYRLPTEAEWEYAARAGSNAPAYWGKSMALDCRYANGPDLSYSRDQEASLSVLQCTDGFASTAPVGSFAPNAFGLYDMLGNVWEWTRDCYHDSYVGAPGDGSAWGDASCGSVSVRGGSFSGDPYDLRAANRLKTAAANRRFSVGFRVVRSE